MITKKNARGHVLQGLKRHEEPQRLLEGHVAVSNEL